MNIPTEFLTQFQRPEVETGLVLREANAKADLHQADEDALADGVTAAISVAEFASSPVMRAIVTLGMVAFVRMCQEAPE